MNYEKPLDKDGWEKHYNIKKLEEVVNIVKSGSVSVWSKELEKIIQSGMKCLEIGCGTGITALWLAKCGCEVCALDYTDASVELVKAAASRLELNNISVMKFDATLELPFEKNQFDYIYQAGLLEHFETEEQIRLLHSWKKYSTHMISLIPNKASIPYQVGKCIQENEGRWEYGREIPKHSFIYEFQKAGIEVQNEYTIGTEWALKFLPENHYVRELYKKLADEGYPLDEYMQGYLLVTIGRNR